MAELPSNLGGLVGPSCPVKQCVLLQDTAAEVAAMTAELNQLTEELLPQGPKTGSLQHEKPATFLCQCLMNSWDGKVSSPMLCVSTTCPLYMQ